MAFNPFRSFRKHQKAWFAGLTIMCMMTFVLCTGFGGDAASALMRLFGGRKGEPVAEMGGDTITDNQLANLRVQRKVANVFMIRTLRTVREQEYRRIKDKIDPDVWRQVQMAFQQRGANQGPQFVDFMLQFVENNLERQKKTAQRTLVRRFRGLAVDEEARAKFERADRFFPGKDDDDALFEFLLWLREADRLDIQLTDSGVKAEVERESYGAPLTDKQWQQLQESVRKDKSGLATPDYLLSALRDEFRVRLAQEAHLGYQPSLFNAPRAAVTPEQLWQFFRKNRSEMEVQVLPLPVKAFEGEVRKKPTTRELQELFNQGKNREHDPASPLPAFKRSRQVKLAWVEGDPDARFYKRYSSARAAVTRLTMPVAWRLRLLQDYQDARNPKTEQSNYELPRWTDSLTPESLPFYPLPAQKGTVHRPALPVAALVGQALGAARGHGPALSAFLAYRSAAFAQETLDRAAVYAHLSLAGLNPLPQSPWLRAVHLAAAWEAASQPRQVPFAVVQDQLQEQYEKQLAGKQVVANMMALKKQLDDYRPADKPLNLRRERIKGIVDEAVKKYGLKKGASTGLRDKFDLGDDPNLKPLEKAYGSNLDDFKALVLDVTDVFIPRSLTQLAEWSAGKQFLYWKTAIEPEQVPRSLAQARSRVVKQWKVQQARQRARKEARSLAARLRKQAEKLADQLKDAGENERKRYLKEYQGAVKKLLDRYQERFDRRIIPLKDVALLQPSKAALPGRGQYERYRIPAATFKYPGDNWVDKILAMQKAGEEVQVLVNKPESVVYVAVRFTPPTPSRDKFRAVFFKSSSPDELWALCQQEYARDFHARLVDQMKKRADFKDLRTKKEKKTDKVEVKEERPEDNPEAVE